MSKLHFVKARFLAVVALAAATALLSVPVASANTPAGPGGCNMLAASGTGIDHMMSGSAHGAGANNMAQMLLSFYPSASFCGA